MNLHAPAWLWHALVRRSAVWPKSPLSGSDRRAEDKIRLWLAQAANTLLSCVVLPFATRRAIIGTLVLLIAILSLHLGAGSGVPRAAAEPTPPDSGQKDRSAAGDKNAPAKPKTVPKDQQYHLELTAAQGSQTTLELKNITNITKIVEKHLDPRAPSLKFTFDEQQGLRLSASSDTAPDVYRLRILGEGCFETQCGIKFNAKVTVTVTPPATAASGVDEFTQASEDRIANAAPLLAGGAVLQDELIITLGSPDHPGTLADAKNLASLVGARVTGGIEAIGVFEFRLPPEVDLSTATSTLTNQPGVSGVSRTTVGLIQANAVSPDDWNDDGEAATWPFTQIRAQQAWDITTGGSSVSVGVVDSGAVYKDHEDLSVTDVLAGSAHYHATHVAGLACAKANGIGLVGVSWGCPIVSSGAGGLTEKEVLAALRNVAKSGVRVVNASLGYSDEDRPNLCLSSDEARDYVREAKSNSAPFWQLFNGPEGRNITWTFSAGNNCSEGPHSPWGATWSLPNVITVAATNSNGKISSFSNFGPGVEVAAPGGVGEGIAGGSGGVWSTSVKTCFLFRKCSHYEQHSGTSMAAPVVAGVAALVQSIDLDKKAADVASCIVNTAGKTVGLATSRSTQPVQENLKPLVGFSGNIPIVNSEAAARCAKGSVGAGAILVVGAGDRTGSGNGTDIGDLTAALVRDEFAATTSATLPEDLSSYRQVWYIDTNALSSAETDRLAKFVESGGSIYLTGEWGCCSVDTSTIALLNRLVTNTNGISHAGVNPGNLLTVSPSAPGGLAHSPNELSNVTVAAAGRLNGVAGANVVAYSGSDATLPAVAAWDQGDVRGSGKIVVVMDVNWFAEQYRGANWEKFAENIAAFLNKN